MRNSRGHSNPQVESIESRSAATICSASGDEQLEHGDCCPNCPTGCVVWDYDDDGIVLHCDNCGAEFEQR